MPHDMVDRAVGKKGTLTNMLGTSSSKDKAVTNMNMELETPTLTPPQEGRHEFLIGLRFTIPHA